MSQALISALLDTLRLGAAGQSFSGRWSGLSLEGLDDLVAYEGAELWLYRRLRATGVITELPEAWSASLRQRSIEIAGTGLRIEATATDVLDRLGAAGIPVVLIKGMARKALAARYPYLDARGTKDVDLLLPEAEVRRAQQLLVAGGFEEAKPGEAIHFHLPAIWNDARVGVELHWTTSVTEPAGAVWRRFFEAGTQVEWNGRTVRVPPVTELAWHAAHHAVSPAASLVTGFRLAHFLEVAALEGAGAELDWELLQRRAREERVVAPDSGEPVPSPIILSWLATARWLGAGGSGPTGNAGGRDLDALLGWRLLVLTRRERLGRALASRLIEEGPRSLIGAPIEPLLPGVGWTGRARRSLGSWGSRAIFRSWRAMRRP